MSTEEIARVVPLAKGETIYLAKVYNRKVEIISGTVLSVGQKRTKITYRSDYVMAHTVTLHTGHFHPWRHTRAAALRALCDQLDRQIVGKRAAIEDLTAEKRAVVRAITVEEGRV